MEDISIEIKKEYGHYKPYIGRIYGDLTILECIKKEKNYTKSIYKCQCKCGKIVEYKGSSFCGKKFVKSCGCYAKKIRQEIRYKEIGQAKYNQRDNIIGQKRNNFTILRCLSININSRISEYEIQCDCGKIRVATRLMLKNKNKINCSNCRPIRTYSLATVNAQYNAHKYCAKRFETGPLKREDWEKIVFNPCFYCGKIDRRTALNEKKILKANPPLTQREIDAYIVNINGVDRIDSSKFYSIDNSRPCCGTCNWLKSDFGEYEFYQYINNIKSNCIDNFIEYYI